MQGEPIYVGLDYHQDFVQVCVLNQEGRIVRNQKSANDWKKIVQAVGKGEVRRVAIEACTGSASLADELIEKAGWNVRLAHAGYVARMKRGPDKTDYTDARILADLERVNYLPTVWLAPERIRELRKLVRYREQRVAQRKAAKLRVSALLREHRSGKGEGGRWSRRWKDWLKREILKWGESSRWILERHLKEIEREEEEIVAVEKQLALLVKEDEVVKKLQSYAGVGLVTACILRAEIGQFDRFASGKQLSRFCGLSPRNASSGNRQADAGLVRAGRPQLRVTLIELAHRLAGKHGEWNAVAARWLAAGKPKNVVIAAVANRWMRKLYHEMKTG